MINFSSDDWHRFRKWAESELDACRIKNDSMSITAEESYAIRGEIRMLKKIIGLPLAVARDTQINSDTYPD